MPVDVPGIINNIKTAVSAVIDKDITIVEGFSERQLKLIAHQTALVGQGIAAGQITGATKDFFLDQLVDMANNFARTLTGLVLATIEKVWHAIVTVIWQAIATITGVPLVPPAIN